MGNIIEKYRKGDATQSVVTLHVSIPEKVLVYVGNLDLIAHGWKDDGDISDTYADLLMQSPRITAALSCAPHLNDGEQPIGGTPAYMQYLYVGREVSTILNLPKRLVSAIEEEGRRDCEASAADYDFSKALISLLMEAPQMQAWAHALEQRENGHVPIRASD